MLEQLPACSVKRLCRQQSPPKTPPALRCTSHIGGPAPPPASDLPLNSRPGGEHFTHRHSRSSTGARHPEEGKKINASPCPPPLTISCSHSDTHARANTADTQERGIKATPPAPAPRTAPSAVDTLSGEGETAVHACRRPCSTRRRPRGRRERPLRPRLAAQSPGPLSQSGFPRSPCISIRNPEFLFKKLRQRKEYFLLLLQLSSAQHPGKREEGGKKVLSRRLYTREIRDSLWCFGSDIPQRSFRRAEKTRGLKWEVAEETEGSKDRGRVQEPGRKSQTPLALRQS